MGYGIKIFVPRPLYYVTRSPGGVDARESARDSGRFPFDQKFRKFRVGERMEQTFSGISFRNFGCTSRGWPKIPENRNNRKILFHSTIPTRASFSEPGNRTTWREPLVESVCQLLKQALG